MLFVARENELANGPCEKKIKEGVDWADFEGEAGFRPVASW
jgi:hypothetical protein